MGIVLFHGTRPNLRNASEVAGHCLGLAQRLHDPSLLVEAYAILGQLSYNTGDFITARTYVEQALMLCEERPPRPSFSVHDPKIFCLTVLAHALWCLGYPKQAPAKSREAITGAEALEAVDKFTVPDV